MSKRNIALRILAAWLVFLLWLPAPVSGLRPESPIDAGLEEQLDTALRSAEVSTQSLIDRLSSSQEPITEMRLWELNMRLRGISGIPSPLPKTLFPEFIRWINASVSERAQLWNYPKFMWTLRRLKEEGEDLTDPVVQAAFAHWFLYWENPVFGDGHHRTGWALMNILLRRAGQSSISFQPNLRESYEDALGSWDNPARFVRFIRSRVHDSTAGAGMDFSALTGLEESQADRFVRELVPGTAVFAVSDAVLENLIGMDATAEGVTVRASTDPIREQQVARLLERLKSVFPAIENFAPADDRELRRRLFTTGNILIRRSIDPAIFREVLEHEWVQRLSFAMPGANQVVHSGFSILAPSDKPLGEHHEMVRMLHVTEYQGQVTPEEFAGQWFRLARIEGFNRQRWQELRAELLAQARSTDPRMAPALREMILLIEDKLGPEVVREVAKHFPALRQALDRAQSLEEPETRRFFSPVNGEFSLTNSGYVGLPTIAQQKVERRRPVSEDMDLLSTLALGGVRGLAYELSRRTQGKKISSNDLIAWWSGKVFLDMVSRQEDIQNAIGHSFPAGNGSVIVQARLSERWDFQDETFDGILCVLALNEGRVPKDFPSPPYSSPAKAYYLHVSQEIHRILKPDGLMILVAGAGGNDLLDEVMRDNNLKVRRVPGSVRLISKGNMDKILDGMAAGIPGTEESSQVGLEEVLGRILTRWNSVAQGPTAVVLPGDIAKQPYGSSLKKAFKSLSTHVFWQVYLFGPEWAGLEENPHLHVVLSGNPSDLAVKILERFPNPDSVWVAGEVDPELSTLLGRWFPVHALTLGTGLEEFMVQLGTLLRIPPDYLQAGLEELKNVRESAGVAA